MNQSNEKLKRLKIISDALDSKFEGPLGLRFGLDALLGFVPVIGDFITTVISIYIIAEASAMGVGPTTLIRMAFNLAVESVIDMVPVLGNFFDIYWKANNKNIILLENHLRSPSRETIKSRMIIGLICLLFILLLFASAYVTYKGLIVFIGWLTP